MQKRKVNLIFKYHACNEYLYKILEDSSVFFQKPENFNDPYDCNLKTVSPKTKEDILENYKEAMESESEPNLSHVLMHAMDNPAAQIKIIGILEKWSTQFIKQVRVSCFSKKSTNLLMWGHYANAHTGVCLGFNEEIMQQTFGKYYEVQYSRKVPLIYFYKNFENTVKEYFSTKSIHWSYEKEVRFLTTKFSNIKFPKEALVQVIFGIRCPEEEKRKIAILIHNAGYQNVQFVQAHIDPNIYRVLGQNLKVVVGEK